MKPYGQSCSPSGGSSGFSVVNTRIIRDLAGAEIRREDFTTVYNGQQNVVCSAAAGRAGAEQRRRPQRTGRPGSGSGRSGDRVERSTERRARPGYAVGPGSARPGRGRTPTCRRGAIGSAPDL